MFAGYLSRTRDADERDSVVFLFGTEFNHYLLVSEFITWLCRRYTDIGINEIISVMRISDKKKILFFVSIAFVLCFV